MQTTRGGVEDTRLEAKAKAKDTKKIRGQGQPFRGQTLSRPRTGMLEAKAKDQGHKAQVLSKKKKKGLHKNFSGDLQKKKKKKKKKRSSQKFFKRSPLKNVFQKIFQALHKILTFQKIVLSSSRGQANFRGLEASRPRPRTSKCVLEDVLEAKDVLEDSTSANYRGISLLSLPGKVYAKCLERKCREIVESKLEDVQCGFRPGRSTTDQIFTLKQIFEKFWEYGKDLFACFADLEKAKDRVPRDKLWKVLQEYGVNGQLLRAH